MQKLVILVSLFVIFMTGSYTQVVTIPDPNFAAYLETIVPSCITGDQLDTGCPAIATITTINIDGLNISDITGVEHFYNLEALYCYNNPIPSIPINLPNTLTSLGFSNNPLTITVFPPNLIHLTLGNCSLTSLPDLPTSLSSLQVSHNLLTSLPILPNGLTSLFCTNNNLTHLPTLPSTILMLYVENNNLYSLPDLPSSLNEIWFDNNPNLTCLPILPDGMYSNGYGPVLMTFGTQITCLPNVPSGMGSAIPLCYDGDNINNPFGCDQAFTIFGKVYQDNSLNCSYDVGENLIYTAKVQLLNFLGDTVSTVYTNANGQYSFIAPAGTYTVALENNNSKFQVTCGSGHDSTFTFTTVAPNIDFAVNCVPGFNIGHGTIATGVLFPGLTPNVIIHAGEMAQMNNLLCSQSISGQVVFEFNGPFTYQGACPGAIVPTSIAGNLLTYDIADFSTINFISDFCFQLQVDSSATIGDSLCINIEITPSTGDSDSSDNNGYLCRPVVNSYDPNIKEVYPVNVEPNYNDWLTYTIYFQNTGTAPAYNIKLRDTLDALLRPHSFELLGSSHPVEISIMGNSAKFFFENIMLADSTSDPSGSIGWIQYRVKPENGLPDGTEINNECYIYFDYNSPILTNTATTYYSLNDLGENETNFTEIITYPNPSTGVFYINMPAENENYNIRVLDMSGRVISQTFASSMSVIELNLSDEENGVYFVIITSGDMIYTEKLGKY